MSWVADSETKYTREHRCIDLRRPIMRTISASVLLVAFHNVKAKVGFTHANFADVQA